MKELAVKIYDFLSAHKWVAWLALAVMVGLSAYQVTKMQYVEDINAFLPHDSKTEKYSEVYAKLGGQDKIAVFFSLKDTTDVYDEEGTLMDAMDAFGTIWEEMDTTGMVGTIPVCTDNGTIFGVFDFISSGWPYFLKEEDYARMDSLLAQPGYLKEKLAEDKRSLSSLSSAVTSRYLRTDPAGLFTPALGRLNELNPTSANNIVDGYLFTKDGHTGVVFFNSPFGGSESGRNGKLLSLLDEVVKETEYTNPDVKVSAVGGPIVAVGNATRIRRDSVLAVSLAMVLILLVLFFSYRRFSDVLWIAVSLVCGALFALGLIALFKSSISIIVLGIEAMIIGIAVNYPLHYIDHLKYQPDKRQALREQVTPLLIGNITTVGAFLGLLMVRSSALRDFGLVGALMLVGTILFVIFFLPALATGREKKATNTLKLDFDRYLNPSPLVRRIGFAVFVILSVVFIILGRKVSFDSDMHNINYMTKEQSDGFALLESMGSDDSGRTLVYVVSESEDADMALEDAAYLAGCSKSAGATVSSICDFVPSSSEQQERLARWTAFKAAHPSLAADIRREADRQGFSKKAFDPFFAVMEKDFEVQDPDFFEPVTSTIGQSMVLRDSTRNTVVSYARVAPEEAATLKKTISENAGTGSFCFDSSDVSNRLAASLSSDFDLIGVVCSLIVFFFLLLSFRSLEITILAFLPLALGWAWILGIMQLTGLQFNIVNIILATFIFGMGDDYTIFITEGLMYERATGKKILMSYKNSVVLSSIIMFLGIGVLVVARHPAMRSVGLVTVIGMFTVVMMAYYLPPLVFRWMTTKKGQMREAPLTIGRILRSLYALLFFLVACLLVVPTVSLIFLIGPATERKKLRYHKFLRRLSRLIIHIVPGTRFDWKNDYEEDFSKPALIISNHQSHLDVMAAMMLTPKLVIMTNDWVWNNPFYGRLIHLAEFYPASEGYDTNLEHLKDLSARGYSILIYPEGTRNPDCSTVQRFHRGAFTLADQLGLDVLPLYIHGFGDVLPKRDFMLRRGRMYLEVGNRIPAAEVSHFGMEDKDGATDWRQVTRNFHRLYENEYSRIRMEREDAAYWAPFVHYQYIYKGGEAAKECFRALSTNGRLCADEFPDYRYNDIEIKDIKLPKGITIESFEGNRVVLSGTGYGAWALLLAKVHHDLVVETKESDEDKRLIASRCFGIPANLIIG